MYINTGLLKTKDLTVLDILLLQLVKQNSRKNDNQETTIVTIPHYDSIINDLFEKGLIKQISGSKKDSPLSKWRTTKEGSTLLNDIETEGVNEDDIILFNILEEVFKNTQKEIGNKKKTKEHIAQFRALSGIERQSLFFLCEKFIEDEDNFKYSHRLEYVFYKPQGAFDTKFQLEQSRLYQYYLKYEDQFNPIFEQYVEGE